MYRTHYRSLYRIRAVLRRGSVNGAAHSDDREEKPDCIGCVLRTGVVFRTASLKSHGDFFGTRILTVFIPLLGAGGGKSTSKGGAVASLGIPP